MPTRRSWFNTAVVDGKIYAIGGNDGIKQLTTVVEEYDPVRDTWKRKADMPTPRAAMATSVVNGKIYAIGGVDGPGAADSCSTVEMYDPATDTWTKKANMPTARWMGVCVSTGDGIIHTIGGETRNGTPTNAVEVYDPATDTWSKRPDIPHWAIGSAAVVDGRFYTQGVGRISSYDGDVESYEPTTGTLRKETVMPTPRNNSAFAAVNGSIYVIGGRPAGGGGGLTTVERFTPDLKAAAYPQGKLPTTWGKAKSDS
jgi:N-acetylneuraminic acid mutarotase